MGARAFSAPGKAFLAGGYLVLDPKYMAYVVALSSRMHAVVRQRGSDTKSSVSNIVITSPQFKNGEWLYEISLDGYHSVKNVCDYNPFLEATIATSLAYIQPEVNFNVAITIFSDPGYHSQANCVKHISNNKNRSFLYHEEPILKVAKTGLGSSAGLVSVVTAALLAHFNVKIDVNVVHNLAQISHCIAQRKIGSGFDVCAAVYGSIIYRRFEVSQISELLTRPSDEFQDIRKYNSNLQRVVDLEWDYEHIICALPSGIRLLMGDIQGGSETPKLVSKVLKWKNENQKESEELYGKLDKANKDFIAVLDRIKRAYQDHPQYHSEALEYFSSRSIDDIDANSATSNPSMVAIIKLIEVIADIRRNLKQLTLSSGAEIEPHQQTLLLDHCNTLKGCLGGVVPGAGGYDAICLLVIEDSVNDIIRSSFSDDRFLKVKWLDLHEVADGIVEEDATDYEGLL
ncbi:uncharacterized protein PRCAT00000554001 [Priceomyces carsonii]|uniref:uncharacterized protein n=1 Tax=Priceomyces carsonii TaxID=28549 RepID=UPI002ED90BB2|nr:unnamed protein product [Priceomyces carsonii]